MIQNKLILTFFILEYVLVLLVEDNTFVAAFISKQINGKRRKTKDTINQQLYVENN